MDQERCKVKKSESAPVTLRSRISEKDVHYKGGIVSGARVLELFGDAATELLIRTEGTEGLLRAYHEVEFLAPVTAGDILEVTAQITRVGNSSRDMIFSAIKVIEKGEKVLSKPVVVAKATGTCVVKGHGSR
jgi:3-aminobutyryl-CoA ammonia-lyase